MSLGVMTDVAIGLALVFLAFSLATSGVYEALARLLQWRAKALWAALYRLIECPPPDDTRGGNRLLHAADEGDIRPTGDAAKAADLASGGPPTVAKLYAHPLVGGLEQLGHRARTRLDRVASTQFARALIDLVVPDADGRTTVTKVRQKLNSPEWAENPLRRQLLVLVSEAGDDVERLRTKVEGWFDAQMETLSAGYRKRAKWFMAFIGIGVAFAFNVNAISLTSRLYEDRALRDAFVEEAERVVDACEAKKNAARRAKCLDDAQREIREVVELPFGWEGRDPALRDVPGIVLSGLAFMQGGPFWFDLLRRLVGFRRSRRGDAKEAGA